MLLNFSVVPLTAALTPVTSLIAFTAVAMLAMVELPAKLSCSVPAAPATSRVTVLPLPRPAPVNVTWPVVALFATCTTTLTDWASGRRAELICIVVKALATTPLVE